MQIIKSFDDSGSFSYSHTRSDIIDIDFHLHDAFEIYFLLSGDVNYFVENKIYELKKGDIMITNKYEIHKPSFMSNKTYERIYIQFSNEIPDMYSTKDFNLLQCFNDRQKGERNRIELNRSRQEEFLELLKGLGKASLKKQKSDIILRNTYFIQLLVLLNNAFSSASPIDKHTEMSKRILLILNFINENLQSDLSLETIEQKFFINKYYLSRLFKKNTGMNLSQYIIYKRLARAKELLSEGHSATDVCYMAGFNDYSNFFRMFKRVIGIPPGQYKK